MVSILIEVPKGGSQATAWVTLSRLCYPLKLARRLGSKGNRKCLFMLFKINFLSNQNN